MLPLCPIAYAGDKLGWSGGLVFILAGLGTVPGAALLGQATEAIGVGVTNWDLQRLTGTDVSSTLGAKVGGLLNATFGNIPELIIGVLALNQGYVALTKATIIGSVIGNAGLVVGTSLLLGGMRNGSLRFDANEAGHHAVLMTLTVAGLALPSLFVATTHGSHVTQISIVAAALLLATYCAYLLYSIFGLRGGIGLRASRSGGPNDETFIEEEAEIVHGLDTEATRWPLRQSIAVLALATLLVIAASDALVDTVKPFTQSFGWSPVFVGIIVVPILANVAEQSSAIMLAYKNKMDMSLGVASGSSIQVAVFVTPVLVLFSQLLHPLDLVFSPIEIAVLALVVVIFFFVSRDGEGNWLEGMQLVALYVLAAAVFFFVPGNLR